MMKQQVMTNAIDDVDRLVNVWDTNQVHSIIAVERHERVVLYLQLILVNYVLYNRLRRSSRSNPVTNKKIDEIFM